jgi:hypothetical protein
VHLLEFRRPRPATEIVVIKVVLAVVLAIFAVSLFKHLSYPLLWNDESYGAMNGKRILTYGYPKVHDGKNCVFEPLREIPWEPFYDAKHDVCRYIPWGNEYLSVPGAFLSSLTDDIFLKTALARLPFAVYGFFGLLLFAFAFRPLFADQRTFLAFSALFFLFELFSISLVLHLREARYYSAAVLLVAVFCVIAVRFFIVKSLSKRKYVVAMTALCVISYFVNYVLTIVFWGVIVVWTAAGCVSIMVSKKRIDRNALFGHLLALLPLMVSAALIAPFEVYFRTLQTARLLTGMVQSPWDHQFRQFGHFIRYFWANEFLLAGFVIKLCACVAAIRMVTQKSASEALKPLGGGILLLNLFFLVGAALVTRSPLLLFTRSFIYLQPVWVLAMAGEFLFCMRWIRYGENRQKLLRSFLIGSAALFGYNATLQIPQIMGHVHEMVIPYRGPLDFIIPFIKAKYGRTDTLVIACDYESTSFMFYLDAKVLVGYVPTDLQEDLRYIPDIIVCRQPGLPHTAILDRFLAKAPYTAVFFPVVNSPVNNIPELNSDFSYLRLNHQFYTAFTKRRESQAFVLIREPQASPAEEVPPVTNR